MVRDIPKPKVLLSKAASNNQEEKEQKKILEQLKVFKETHSKVPLSQKEQV